MSDGSFTVADVALHFNVKQSTVRNWINDGCPCERFGKGIPAKFDIVKVVAWRNASASAGARLDPQKEKAMLDRERRLKVATERKLLEGRLIKLSEVEDHWSSLVAAARAKFLSMPHKLAPAVVACSSLREVEDETRRLINEALDELAGTGVPDGVDLEIAAESDDQSVGGYVSEAEPGGECGAGTVADGPGTLPEGDA